jgi:hypothetical protein
MGPMKGQTTNLLSGAGAAIALPAHFPSLCQLYWVKCTRVAQKRPRQALWTRRNGSSINLSRAGIGRAGIGRAGIGRAADARASVVSNEVLSEPEA